jgi:amino acid transporter
MFRGVRQLIQGSDSKVWQTPCLVNDSSSHIRSQAMIIAGEIEAPTSTTTVMATTIGVKSFQVWALGITVVVGGQYTSWNVGLQAGFGSFLIATCLIGLAYICLVFCNAEISSALPFAGGAYGLARLSLGFYPGFLIGCCEAIEYILYVAEAAIVFSNMIVEATSSPTFMMPVYCFLFYLSALTMHIWGGKWFWRSTTALGILSLGILLIYCFGSLPWVDINLNAPSPSTTGAEIIDGSTNQSGRSWFIGGFNSFLFVLPLAAWFYVGVESLNFCNAVASEVSIRV